MKQTGYKLKNRLLTKINLLLGTLIALLGIGCKSQKVVIEKQEIGDTVSVIEENNRIVAMYGIPSAKYVIEGAITNRSNEPLEGKQVIVHTNTYSIDTLYTNNDGRFESSSYGFPTDSVTIEVNDPEHLYESTQKKAAVVYDDKKDTWNYGTGKVSVNIHLQKTKSDMSQIRVKYGIPHSSVPTKE
ncbi:MAG: radical SAM-associated putative lipoprotein [Paludibacter sp.]|nr:radical SAM-associated putative lipoprotein [Bacteroidales bacterium]MCM1068462.1 radical SAM-associated putative lipoprotein [Prevotella sp.]MCM1353416.1 radical SAM-associated putative lipoprotein [Bacteroides sp.]MCM1442577.1 radical SAM-associated putative lipoprotein [Muribaculum sp.]MCM1481422.1 radical SAM-associated putative lipoprotein [Paludibacter sp.]